jgi:flagellar basal-body rod protein FlgC
MMIDRLFAGLNISASGLAAQRKKLNAIASNMANAETTKTETGEPYKRKLISFRANGQSTFAEVMKKTDVRLSVTSGMHFDSISNIESMQSSLPGSVKPVELEDTAPFKQVYDPNHPDANEEGFVKMPNVNVVTEMVDMISASRAYEANITAVNAAKQIAKDALEI